MLQLHGLGRTDLVAGELAAPPGRVQADLCTATGHPAGPDCSQHLVEWVRPGTASRPPAPVTPPAPRLAIVQPDNNTHLWRNPELPGALNRLVLRAAVEPAVPQVVWLVNGEPISVAAPDAPLVWTMAPGRYRFQIRLPLQDTVSPAVTVVVE